MTKSRYELITRCTFLDRVLLFNDILHLIAWHNFHPIVARSYLYRSKPSSLISETLIIQEVEYWW